MALYLKQEAGGEEGNIRGLVENCAHNDDITPLVRLLFEAQSLADSPSIIAADGQQMVSIICSALRAVAADQGAAIDDVCHSNATAIAQTVAELEHMQSTVEDVKASLMGANQTMQQVGSNLVTNVQNVNRLAEVQDNLQQAAAAVRAAQGVLEQCMAAGQLINEHQLYPALCMLDKIRRKHLASLLSMLSNKGAPLIPSRRISSSSSSRHHVSAAQQQQQLQAQRAAAAASAAAAIKRLSGRDLEHLQQLHAFFSGLVDDMAAAVQRLALQGFNQWLVSMRACARDVGLLAIQAALVERCREEDLGAERKALLAALAAPGGRSVRDIAAELAKSPFRQDLLKEASPDADKQQQAVQQDNNNNGGNSSSAAGFSSVTGSGSGSFTSADASSLRELLKRPSRKWVPAAAPLAEVSSLPRQLPDLEELFPGEPQRAIHALVQQQKQRRSSSVAVSGRSSPQRQQQQQEPPQRRPIYSLLDVDMAGCHAAVHVAKSLGCLDAFRQHYLDQRRLQVSADLQPPQDFLESHRAYLAQVAGFFVIESYVQRVTDGLVGPAEGAALWAGAQRSLKATLEAAFDQLGTASLMLMVKDFVLLVCVALERAGYQVAPVIELLQATQARYHELLSAQLQGQVAAVVEADVLSELEIRSEAQHAATVAEYGLPWQLEGAGTGRRVQLSASGVPPLPYVAPFTCCVPEVLSLVRRYVIDSLAYLRGLHSPQELLPAVLHQRDRMLGKVLVEVLSLKARSVASEEMLRECMKVAANAWALSAALDGLDDWTIQQARPEWAAPQVAAPAPDSSQGSSRAGLSAAAAAAAKLARARNRKAAVASGALTNTVQAALRALQDASERDVLRSLTGRIEQLLEGSRKGDWCPGEALPASQSGWVDALLSYLQETFDAGLKLLPRFSVVHLMRLALRATATAAMRAFGPEGVKGFNLYAVEKLSINVATIERFAGRWGVASLADELAEPNQLCRLLLSSKLEDILEPQLRRQRYSALELSAVALALDKYRELPQQAKRRPEWPTKKAVDAVAKQLRAQMVSGAAGMRGLDDA
ncbi:hypothetical protein OEZ85_006525 [Tetradesmus obliquus]|uniref:Uncharacterized protein n=1 Tax=Tetradesmus obliquus TaxID=3088 RepID=A0ABY8TUW3_TETOB|nr:hypothetical protein OEZ85_006525 [Tetradesmus obliquus]